jgi:hypothetical protein
MRPVHSFWLSLALSMYFNIAGETGIAATFLAAAIIILSLPNYKEKP